MKTHINMAKGKGTTRVSNQQVVFELKHRVVLALNKLGDRDTYQIAVEELEKIIEGLTPDGIAPFMSCILDTDSEKKSAVRKECIRLMGAMATFHEGLIGPHLVKIVASIVKRLKDTDSVVRDACVETVGVLASKFACGTGEGDEDGVFVVLVRPLFEALGEQNRQVQSGAALCLARVIDSIRNPPASILQRMLAKTVKLLKNPHFLGKPAVIELNRSIIQAGGATTHTALSTAMTSIQEALKNSDWTTRKAAAAALGDIASSGGEFFTSFKSSCLRSLESCRFDKVKPVRDMALQALHMWRNISGPDTPEPSDAGSSLKENYYKDDCADTASASESTLKSVTSRKVGNELAKNRVPHSFRKAGHTYVENSQHSTANDWQIEIAVPKSHKMSTSDIRNQESEGSSVTKSCERSVDMRSTQDIEYECIQVDVKQECSSVSTLFPENFERSAVTAQHDALDDEGSLVKPMMTGQESAREEISIEEQRYFTKMRDRRSLDSTVTESSSHTMHGCCSQAANEIVFIRKQLLEIENKQSNLMDMLKVFTSNVMDSLSMVQLKVSSLEQVVGRMGEEFAYGGRYSDQMTSKILKRSPGIPSPRVSTSTPRSSFDVGHRQSQLSHMRNTEVGVEKTFTRSRSSSYANTDMRKESNLQPSKNSVGKGIQKSSGQGTQGGQTRKNDHVFAPGFTANARQNYAETQSNLWKAVKGYLSERDLESAYVEALYSGDELVLFELLDRTGPVLENLSQKTASNLLSTLASFFLEQRYVNTIIPWLQQVVDLNTIQPNYLVLSAKARREFLSAIEDAMNMEFSNPAQRRSVTQLARNLRQIWGKCI